jgi:D-lactate dehydrogenase
MNTLAVFDTKPYDRDYLSAAMPSGWAVSFHEFRLTSATAGAARGARAVCAFVNDRLDGACLGALSGFGIRHLALRCAGFNNVALEEARRLGLAITRVPAYSPHAVAEHTLALLLALNRRIHRAYNRVRELNFSLAGLVGFDLHGKTVGIVGTGKIGRITAELFQAFGCTVLVQDPVPDAAWATARGLSYRPLEDLLRASDVVSLHAPLTPQTHHLLNARTLELIKPGAHVVNTSRGALIDTAALIEALKSGRVGGVALDVYEEEEGVFFEDLSGTVLQDDVLSRLLTFPNVLITAHQAFLTHEALSEISRVTWENVRRAAEGGDFLSGTRVV